MTDEIGISIDAQQLAGIVAQALAEPTLRLGKWQIKPLSGGLELFNRVYLLSGLAKTSSGERTWSLVLKTMLCDSSNEATPQATRYWKREAAFYQSGLLDDPSCRVVPPRCYQVSQQGDVVWIWLQAIQDELPRPWPTEKYGEAARCLGCFNGAYLVGKPLPVEPWLSQHWLRGYLEQAAPIVKDLPELRKLPFFQKTYAEVSNDFMLQAWERRGEFLNALERLPQVFCHQDAIDGNLLWRGDAAGQNQLVALDWAYSGNAALGEELAPLVLWRVSAIPEFENQMRFYELCLQGYLAGLADAGYTADAQQVRFASLATIFYRYFYGVSFSEFWNSARDEANHPVLASRVGVPAIDILFNLISASVQFHKAIYRQISDLLPQMP
jgi:hypothetical protein